MHVLLSSAIRDGVTVDKWWPSSSQRRQPDNVILLLTAYYCSEWHAFLECLLLDRDNENNAKNYHEIEIVYICFRDGFAKKSVGLKKKNERKKVKTKIKRYTRVAGHHSYYIYVCDMLHDTVLYYISIIDNFKWFYYIIVILL
jgi:hypothetical protein